MTPIYMVLADSINITAALKNRLISIRTSDEAGFKSDTCTIELDDRDGLIELPRHGAKLEVWLGYQHTGLSKIGVYVVDEVTLSGFPQTLSINAKAANMREDLKSQKTRSFDNITLGDLVKTIAGENGLTGKTAPELASITFPHLDQTEESDMHLLTRLAKQHGGIAKVTHDQLIVASQGQAKSVSGSNLQAIIINKRDVSGYRMTIADRGKYEAVTATYHDKATGKKVVVSTGDSKTSYTLRHTYNDQESAIVAAKGKQKQLDKGATTVEVTLAVGNGNLFAESPMTLIGFRTGIDGRQWTATRVEHDFSASGFMTRIEAEISN